MVNHHDGHHEQRVADNGRMLVETLNVSGNILVHRVDNCHQNAATGRPPVQLPSDSGQLIHPRIIPRQTLFHNYPPDLSSIGGPHSQTFSDPRPFLPLGLLIGTPISPEDSRSKHDDLRYKVRLEIGVFGRFEDLFGW